MSVVYRARKEKQQSLQTALHLYECNELLEIQLGFSCSILCERMIEIIVMIQIREIIVMIQIRGDGRM